MAKQMTEAQRTRRNVNPHAEAVAAMFLWPSEYAGQNGGSMDFWDGLDARRKRYCKDLIDRLATATGRDSVCQ